MSDKPLPLDDPEFQESLVEALDELTRDPLGPKSRALTPEEVERFVKLHPEVLEREEPRAIRLPDGRVVCPPCSEEHRPPKTFMIAFSPTVFGQIYPHGAACGICEKVL